MTTSTPPAWGWLNERWVPAETPELPIRTPKPPESDALSEQNDSDQCDECRCAPGQPHALGCDEAAKVTDAQSCAGPEHVVAESCPECGTVTDIEYVDEGPSVPFPVQSWTFEALIETEVEHLHEIIDDHHDEIVEMARRRHREGFVEHGSKGYQWDAETRLRNVLEELSDAPTYLTMGPIE